VALDGHIEVATKELCLENRVGHLSAVELNARCESLRWFVLPQQAADDCAELKIGMQTSDA
jgi:hypothetical protein